MNLAVDSVAQPILFGKIRKINNLLDQFYTGQNQIKKHIDKISGPEAEKSDTTIPSPPASESVLDGLDEIADRLERLIHLAGDNRIRLEKLVGENQ